MHPHTQRFPNASRLAFETQRRFDELLDNLPAGVVVHGADGRVLSVNRLAAHHLGATQMALIGREATAEAWHFLRADGALMLPSEYPVNQVLRTGHKLDDLVAGVPGPRPGEVRWLLCNAYPEFDDGRRLRRVIVCFTDCTSLKRAEQLLEKSEERLRLALQGSTDAPWDWDVASGTAYYSDRWWTMLGYTPGELAPDAGRWIRLAHPDDRPRLIALVRELLTGGRQTYEVEFRLRHRDGHYVPVLSRGFVLRDSYGNALRLSGTNTDLTERKEAEQRIYELAYFDQLTGLPNRRLLIEELDKALARSKRSERAGALLFIDLDNFKLLNDTMGHEAGDLLLHQVAHRLREATRESDQLSRLGGDEFVVVLENLGPAMGEAGAQAGQVGRKILDTLGRTYELPLRSHACTPSIGITLFDGATDGIETVLKQADLAMYRAKADGRNTVRFFDPSMQAAADSQADLEIALRHGLAARQFVLYCQPQFGSDGALAGAEVLLRWQHGKRGLVGPDEFIDLAEASGLIVPLGQHVLEESCRALARWAADPLLSRLKLAVNVSVSQLRDPAFPQVLAAALEATGARRDRLWLELTESVFADDTAVLIEQMHALCAQGVRLSLDDFGTGYSSLAYLRRFPLAALKIDRSFIHDLDAAPDGAPLVDAIVTLARKLGLQTVAEGVEHEAQRSYLLDCGCDVLQGFLLGRPVEIGTFERLYGAGSPLQS
jgi:diguanylate cyclase (GGDEF)-like protein/PAS domain S-box-containing protein